MRIVALIAYMFASPFLSAQGRSDCIKGTVINSTITSLDLCAPDGYGRSILELRTFHNDRLVQRLQTTSEPIIFTTNSRRTKITIRGKFNDRNVLTVNGRQIQLFFDRPFRGGEIGQPYTTHFHWHLGRRHLIWPLLKTLCDQKAAPLLGEPFGLSNRQLKKVIEFAKSRLAFYRGDCQLERLYDHHADVVQ